MKTVLRRVSAGQITRLVQRIEPKTPDIVIILALIVVALTAACQPAPPEVTSDPPVIQEPDDTLSLRPMPRG
ncbi:MAG: hypothetical protein AAF667_18600 [Pseudomonadota bacterium]